MKISISQDESRIAMGRNPLPSAARCPRPATRGMALIITLILLSVTLVMAIALLAIAHRERNAVTTTTDTTTARHAAEAALAAAQSQVAANILATNTAAYVYHFFVSTNYINPLGFAVGIASPTNVNYFYRTDGSTFFTPNQRNQNIANLFLLPRAPVFVPINGGASYDFRYYLDLNRNGRYDTNGYLPAISADPVNPFFDMNGNTMPAIMAGNTISNLFTGDPEWIGVLEHPDQPHGPNNKFVARYAFAAVPLGNTLDVNYIHNQAISRGLNAANDGFFRNQGVGSWELNLAAFLTDLNTNIWSPLPLPNNLFYSYNQPASANVGIAFNDALALLAYRYVNYNTLLTANQLFPNAGNVFPFDNIDAYSDGPLQFTTTNIDESLSSPSDGDKNSGSFPWPGADNVNHFFTPGDFFSASKTSANFATRLWSPGTSNDTYNSYTYYRLLDQLGTDSTAEPGKLNLNYSNAIVNYNAVTGVVTNINIIPGAETNLVRWLPLNFFHAAADMLLRSSTSNWLASSYANFTNTFGATTTAAFGVTNIPVYVNGQFVYSPAVNRLLQLAANIYDATTNSPFPSVFRPVFTKITGPVSGYVNIYINSFQQIVTSTSIQQGVQLRSGMAPVADPTVDLSALINGSAPVVDVNVFGVPWIIGAKKGFPAFNQLSMANMVQIARKLQITRDSLTAFPANYLTNQMVAMSINNNVGLSFWNSYNNAYPRPLTIYATDWLSMSLTNGKAGNPNIIGPTTFRGDIPSTVRNSWPGSSWATSALPPAGIPYPGSFFVTNWTFTFLFPSVYHFSTTSFDPVTYPTAQQWDSISQLPQFGLLTTNYLQAVILDGTQVIDYVQLRDPINLQNLNQVLADPNYPDAFNRRYQWSTNQPTGTAPNWGILNQIVVSMDPALANAISGNSWVSPSPKAQAAGFTTPEAESAYFKGFFTQTFQYGGVNYVNSDDTVQVPYTPSRTIYNTYLLQVNDPLVHYLASDLGSQPGNSAIWHNGTWKNGYWYQSDDLIKQPLPQIPPTPVKGRYQPWGQNVQMATIQNADTNAYSLSYKDPIVWGSDNWDFPTNNFPSIGWIGRVHRGTPWQTVFLKSTNILVETLNLGNQGLINIGLNTWAQWTGDIQTVFNQNQNYYDAFNSAPVWDRLLFDVFTTRFNDNAVRGTLSVNQDHLAAWSALFSGMTVLSNNTVSPHPAVLARPTTTYFPISPAGLGGNNSALGRIVNDINATRSNTNMFPYSGFTHAGSILATPALTDASPFLNRTGFQTVYGISDEMYEWLPQQMMGLVRFGDPRYVIYCYGQALRPAPNAMVTIAGAYFGMVTNYQVVAETTSRAVIHLDKHATPSGTNYSTVLDSYNVLPAD